MLGRKRLRAFVTEDRVGAKDAVAVPPLFELPWKQTLCLRVESSICTDWANAIKCRCLAPPASRARLPMEVVRQVWREAIVLMHPARGASRSVLSASTHMRYSKRW